MKRKKHDRPLHVGRGGFLSDTLCGRNRSGESITHFLYHRTVTCAHCKSLLRTHRAELKRAIARSKP